MTQNVNASPERTRLVVLLSILIALVLGAAVYFVFLTGGEEVVSQPAPAPVTQEEAQTSALVADDGEEAVVITAATSSRDPFEPLAEEKTTSEDKGTSKSTTSSSPKSSTSKTTESQRSTPARTTEPGDSTTGRSDPVDVQGTQTDDETAPADENVVPEPITTGESGEDAVPVAVVDVQADSAVVRIDGDRIKLYISIPGPEGVTYVAPLGGGCAWLGKTDSEVRVSVCKGKTERL